jgi:hypothetical protein
MNFAAVVECPRKADRLLSPTSPSLSFPPAASPSSGCNVSGTGLDARGPARTPAEQVVLPFIEFYRADASGLSRDPEFLQGELRSLTGSSAAPK